MKNPLYLLLLVASLVYAQGPAPIAAPGAISTWFSGQSYSTGNVVIQYGIAYQSLINSNTGNSPVANPSDWTTVVGSGSSVPSVFGRSGAVTANSGDYTVSQVTGAAPLASPALTGTPTAPTAGSCASNTTIATGAYVANCGGSGSVKVVYVSKLASIPATTAVVPGSSASGTTDASSIINAAIAGGNVDLEVDGGYALSTSLVLSSNTTIHCTSPQYGFIMQATTNLPAMINAHQNAPTTTSGTGGYLVSNITDKNITVRGCTINANGTQAVTAACSGSGSSALNTNPSTGLYVNGVQFVGVSGITFDSNEVYDSGTYLTFFSNASNVYVTNNYLHVPTPQIAAKGDDGVHFIGPAQFLWVQNNHIISGDDSIALNADDGNRTGSGSGNIACAQWTGVKWGPITDGHIDHNTLDGTYYGLRLLSATELIDRIEVTDLSGTACGNTGTMNALWSGTLGPGNLGKIIIDGWTVQTTGTCNTFSVPYNFILSENIQDLEINNVKIANPVANWPVLTQTGGTVGILAMHNWDLTTQFSTFSPCVVDLAGGTLGQVQASGMSWYDAVGSGSLFCGSNVPNTLTVSNYAGPNLLLASGFAPTNQNGDAFTNAYSSTTTYVNTIFNEQTSGTNLAGTAPATCANGCSGDWTAAADYPTSVLWTYGTGTATGASACTTGFNCPVYINVGHASYTARINFSNTGIGGVAMAVVPRYTDNNNNVFIACATGSVVEIYDIVAGTATLEATSSGSWGCPAGLWTIVMNGTSVSVTTTAGTLNGTISSSNTATNIGVENYSSSGNPEITMTSFSVKSN